MVFSPRWRRREPGMSYSRWANSRTICCNSPRARRSRLTRGPSTDRRNKALGSIAFMGTHLVDEGYAAQLDSLGSDSGQNLWGERKSGVLGKSVSGRLDLGGLGILKKKKKIQQT